MWRRCMYDTLIGHDYKNNMKHLGYLNRGHAYILGNYFAVSIYWCVGVCVRSIFCIG